MWSRLLVRLLWWRYVKACGRAKDRGPSPTFTAQAKGQEDRSGATSKCTLVRIIGNDLVPRHRAGQGEDNLRFILEHEPELAGCNKVFLLNHIVDPVAEDRIVGLLEHHGAVYRRLSFDEQEFLAQPWDVEGVPSDLLPPFRRFDSLWSEQAGQVLMRLYRHRNHSVIHNNPARNFALDWGRESADWVLPWDGNCFVTEKAWNLIRSSLEEAPEFPYRIVPMVRLTDNRQVLDADFVPRSFGEPQVVFRHDAQMQFDDRFYYGRRPKVELLWRLGVPGPWDDWGIQPWDFPCPAYGDEAGGWRSAGWVGRLASGRPDLERRTNRSTSRRRMDARSDAVIGFLDQVEGRLVEDRLDLLSQVAMAGGRPPGEPDARLLRGRLEQTSAVVHDVRWSNLPVLFEHVFLLERCNDRQADRRARDALQSWFERHPPRRAGALESAAASLRKGQESALLALAGLFWFLPSIGRLQARLPESGHWVEGIESWLLEVQDQLLWSRHAKALARAESSAGFACDLIVTSLGIHSGRGEWVGSGLRSAACRLARTAHHGRAGETAELSRRLALLVHLNGVAEQLGWSFWRYPAGGKSWMLCWLESCLEDAGSDEQKRAGIAPAVAGARQRCEGFTGAVAVESMEQNRGLMINRPAWWLDLSNGVRMDE